MRFEDMEVWKRSSHLSVEIYKQLTDLQDLSFKDQISASGLLLTRSIAESFSRATEKEKRDYLNHTKGTCAELRVQIYVGIEINYIPNDVGHEWLKDTVDISSMLTGLIKFMDRKAVNYCNDTKPIKPR